MVFGLRVFTAHQSGPWLTGRTPEDPLVQDSLTELGYELLLVLPTARSSGHRSASRRRDPSPCCSRSPLPAPSPPSNVPTLLAARLCSACPASVPHAQPRYAAAASALRNRAHTAASCRTLRRRPRPAAPPRLLSHAPWSPAAPARCLTSPGLATAASGGWPRRAHGWRLPPSIWAPTPSGVPGWLRLLGRNRVPVQNRSLHDGAPSPTVGAKCQGCRATYAKGWLIMEGANIRRRCQETR